MKRKFFILLVLFGLLCGFSTNAYAQTAPEIVTAEDLDKILSVAREFGTAELTTDSEGDPKISGEVYTVSYSILFYGCEDNKNCKEISFFTGWGDFTGSEEDVREWSWRRGFGQAAVRNGDALLKMKVNLNKGVTMDNFRETFRLWTFQMVNFGDTVVNK